MTCMSIFKIYKRICIYIPYYENFRLNIYLYQFSSFPLLSLDPVAWFNV